MGKGSRRMSFLPLKYYEAYGKGKYITKQTCLKSENDIICSLLKPYISEQCEKAEYYQEICFHLGIPMDVKEKINTTFKIDFTEHEEGYVIDAEENIHVYSPSERGLFYGCISLLEMIQDHRIETVLAYDYPVCSVRGMKVYLPGRENIPYFKEFVDMICRYKYNTIMIEVGGAMEYKRHPEINEGWIKYCEEMSEYSGKTTVIQEKTFPWLKNSIHVENGVGRFLDQDTVKELIAYCKERHLHVIPEVPSLSHCDYLLINHHEIKERAEDPYPDTYCPSNPKSYELLFDVFDEIIDVFEPTVMNVGHDEYYSIGLCDKCRTRKPEEIYTEDVMKIKNYLAKFGVKTLVWGEKLLNGRLPSGRPCGGAEIKTHYEGEVPLVPSIPATHKAIDLVPEDLLILHWYWEIDEAYEEEYLKRNMEVIYGNFSGFSFPHWQKRIHRGIKGGIISNWSTLKAENLQRNRILFDMVYSSWMFWKSEYEEAAFKTVRDAAFKELYKYKYRNALKEMVSMNALSEGIRYIKVKHTTDYKMEYRIFADGVFIEQDLYNIGEYVITYEDGSKAALPVVFGMNISNKDVSWEERDDLLLEASFTTLPMQENNTTYYECIYENPYPEKRILGVQIAEHKGDTGRIYMKEIEFF